jgi:signal transduction histidine kinase
LTLSIFLFSIKLSYESGLENTLLYFLVAPFLFFPVSEWKKVAFTAALPMIAYGILHAGAYGWMEPVHLSPFQLALFRNSIMATTAALLLVPFFFLFFAQVKTEASLILARDEAELASQAKSTFMALVSHELRTPLNGLMGTLQLLENDSLNKEQQELLQMGRTSGELLQTLISDLLDFTRLEKDQVRMDSQPLDLARAITHSLSLLRPVAKGKGLTLHVDLSQQFPLQILGDATRIQQVVMNLIGNAIKYTDSGTIHVRLGQLGGPFDPEWVDFSVEDTGIGISPEKLDSLFKPFSQVHQSHLGARMGVGLGLTICKKLADLMGGRIEVQSKPGEGSTFRFLFPLKRINSHGGMAHPPTILTSESIQKETFTAHVLVVEDVIPNQTVARKMLERLGLTVDVVENGQEAVKAFSEKAYYAIFMDCQMPIMDGISATRAIRKKEAIENLKPIPIIALTANAFEEDRKKCEAAGMNGFLSKPLKKQQLVEIMHQVVRLQANLTKV